MTTLAEARNKWFEDVFKDGGTCPCCDRFGKVYPRPLNKTMISSLVWLARHKDWVDVPNLAPKEITRTNQLPTLRWWGLVERMDNDKPGQKHSGVWRVTPKGREFVHEGLKIPERVYTYNGEVVSEGDKLVGIEDIDKGFLYPEVMEPVL